MLFTRNPATAAPARHQPPAPRRRTRLAAALSATAATAAAAITLTAATAGAASASTSPPPHANTLGAAGNASGLPWASGAYLPANTPAAASAFAAWRGRPLDVVTAWGNRATWSDIENPGFLYQRFRGSPDTLAFGVAMIPEKVAGASIQACASGAYNSHWQEFGRVISSYGLGRSIIRLGWEFNGGWYTWKATQPATWAECWRQIVTSARATAPGLQWDWNVNRGVTSGLTNPALAYPGNAYVDTIGVDSYDMWPAASTDAGWQTQLNGTQGLNYWLAFATQHGKKLAIPEWGNVTTGSSAGGDDPAYVQHMHDFFAANASNIAYESIFQSNTVGGAYGTGTSVPNSAAAYQAGF
jgi:Glycosyl hydrolase family 26